MHKVNALFLSLLCSASIHGADLLTKDMTITQKSNGAVTLTLGGNEFMALGAAAGGLAGLGTSVICKHQNSKSLDSGDVVLAGAAAGVTALAAYAYYYWNATTQAAVEPAQEVAATPAQPEVKQRLELILQ